MIKDNIFKIKEQIGNICSRINRDPRDITIVAVAKDRPADEIREVLEAGITDIGENRVQEAVLKYKELANPRTCEPANLRTCELGNSGPVPSSFEPADLPTCELANSPLAHD